MKLIVSLLVLFAFVAPAVAIADTKVHPTAQVQFWLPDSWEIESEEGDRIVVAHPDGQLQLVFAIQKAKSMQALLEDIVEVMDAYVDHFIIEKREDVTLNGLKMVAIDGKGRSDGVKVDVGAVVVQTPSGKFLTIVGVAPTANGSKYDADVEKIFTSLKPVKGKFGR